VIALPASVGRRARARQRVVRGLERAARRRIVVVTGRRGSGKSIALSAFAASTGAVTYVVREEHDTAAAFARGLVEALAHARPDLLRTLSAAYAACGGENGRGMR